MQIRWVVRDAKDSLIWYFFNEKIVPGRNRSSKDGKGTRKGEVILVGRKPRLVSINVLMLQAPSMSCSFEKEASDISKKIVADIDYWPISNRQGMFLKSLISDPKNIFMFES